VALIYRSFDKANLDREYLPNSPIPDIAPYLAAYPADSQVARDAVAGWSTHHYGPTPREALDFFPAPGIAKPPLHIFIHGGFWRRLSKDDSSYPAPGFTQSGVAYVALDYALAPVVTLDEIVRQCRAAIVWLHAHAAELGFDPDRIVVSGSSAGGHLTAMLVATDWTELGLPADAIKAGIALSGVFDLEPIRLTYVNAWLDLDDAAVARLSPLHMPPRPGTPMLVAVGDIETDEFKRHSREYADMCRAAGLDCEHMVVPDRNHFDLPYDLPKPDTMLGAAVLRLMARL
jgi:arylformamidase